MKKIVLASALFLSLGSAHAAGTVRWDNLSLSYESAELDGENFIGAGIAKTQLIAKNVYIEGSYRYISDDTKVLGSKLDMDLKAFSLGIGYRHALTVNTDFFSTVLYEELEFESSFQGSSKSKNENSYGLELGMRSLVSENIELRGAISYLDVSDQAQTSFSASVMYHFTDRFSASIGYSNIDEADFISLSGFMHF